MIRLIFTFLLLFLTSFTYAADYYWVGGGGNWSDINHWATTSGGTNYHTVVPSQNDDVYFDGNSGFTASSRTVIMDNTVQSCRTFSNSFSIIFQDESVNELRIFGSFIVNSGTILNLKRFHLDRTKLVILFLLMGLDLELTM